MIDPNSIAEHTEVIGADGVRVRTLDGVENGRIKLEREGQHRDHHHYIDANLVAGIEDGVVRLSADADVAVLDETKADGKPLD